MLPYLLALIQVFDFLRMEAKLMAMKAFMEGSTVDMLCDDPFDSIDDLLNFPNDDDALALADACGDGVPLAPPPAPNMICSGSGGGITEGLHGRPPAVAGGGVNSDVDALGVCSDMDTENLEWLSYFFEDSEFNFDFPATTGLRSGPNNTINEEGSLFRSSSPISVLEPTILSGGASTAIDCGGASSTTTSSSSSSTSIRSGGRLSTAANVLIVPGRARSKRPRPPSFSARSFLTSPSEHSATTASSWPANPQRAGEPCPVLMKREKAVTVMGGGEGNSVGQAARPVTQMRKCMHCQIHKTPQWRAGPMGPKTLCNACGVRYKSGRLFPEYRPAASPTFVPSIHSNSHRRVVEMRLKATLMAAGDNDRVLPMERTVAVGKSCDLLDYIRWRD